MASVKVNGNKIIPAPFVTIGKEEVYSDDGRPINSNYRISLNGTLLPDKGSPSTTQFWTGDGYPPDETLTLDDDKFHALLLKQKLLENAFRQQGFLFTWQPNSYCSVQCYPKLRDMRFNPDNWVIKTDYNIELEANNIVNSENGDVSDIFVLNASGLYLSKVSDDWQIRAREDGSKVYEISRVVSATANTAYASGGIVGTEAWDNAKSWVSGRIANFGLHNSNIFGLPSGLPNQYYNVINEESVNRIAGTYSQTQRYIYHSGNYIEQRTISYVEEPPKTGDNPPYITRINVNGRIEGLDYNNDPSGKLLNALTYWNSIKGTLGTLVGANGSGIVIQHDEDYFNGIVNYSLQFINNSGSTYRHNFDVSFNISDNAFPTITINGTVEGVTTDDYYGPNLLKFGNAVTGFTSIRSNLKALAFSYGNGVLFGAAAQENNYSDYPINKSISYNRPAGTVSYSYTFGYLDQGSSSTYTDQYQVELSTQNAPQDGKGGLQATATINGVIQGLIDGNDDPSTRITNATNAWSTVGALLYTRASNEFSKIGTTLPSLNSRTVNRTVGVNRVAGQITYSATFNNFLGPSDSNVAVLDMQIDQTFPQDIVAVQVIPGRASGPIIQNIGTISEQRRNINLTMTLWPKSGSYWGISDSSTVRAIASGYFASGVSDLGSRGSGWFLAGRTENWDWKNGLYQGSISVILTSGIG